MDNTGTRPDNQAPRNMSDSRLARSATLPRLLLRAALPAIVFSGSGIVAAWLLDTRPPAELLADQATRVLPPEVFAFILDNLQYWGKPVLLIGLTLSWLIAGVALSSLALWAVSARPSLNRPGADLRMSYAAGAIAALAGLFLVPFVAGLGALAGGLPEGAAGYSAAVAISAAAFAVAFYLVATPPPGRGVKTLDGPEQASIPAGVSVKRELPAAAEAAQRGHFGRRQFLVLGASAGLVVAGSYLLSRTTLKLLSNAKAVAAQLTGSVVPEVTPTKDFYVVSKNFSDPEVEESGWRLEVNGEVGAPLSLTLAELREMPAAGFHATLECISNEVGGGLISNALWKGVPLRDVLRAAGIKETATHILTTAADGYTESMPVQDALAEDVLLAYEMNGEPITREHGFPVRLLYPDHFGMKNTKWVTLIEAATSDRPGYWERRGWDNEAFVKTMTRIDVPGHNVELPLGPVVIAGISFSGARGISRVEVSTDAGATWTEARLKEPLSKLTWVHWRLDWLPPAPGRYEIAARARDLAGAPQIAQEWGPFPSGATGYHMIRMDVLKPQPGDSP